MTKPRRRQAGEGGISAYETKAGPRFLIKYTYPKDDGSRGVVLKRGYLTRKAAAEDLRTRLASLDTGAHVAPNRTTVADHFDVWLDGLRKQPSTVASYRKNVRLHVVPHIGSLRLEQLTGTRLTKLYRHLEREGRADGKGGLSARTVRYVATIVHAGLGSAVRDGLLSVNPADKADPPTAKASASPEMRYWSAEQLRAFLDHSLATRDELHPAWTILAMTGMRRGEVLALRWGDVDFEAGRLAVRRSVTLVQTKGEGEEVLVGPPKSGKPRVIDLAPQTLATLRAHRAAQGALGLSLARDEAYVLADLSGHVRHPERFSRRWVSAVKAAHSSLDDVPVIRLHDLRHTHATVLLGAGIPVKVVSERLGHASATITLGAYAHVMPGMQREAADRMASLVYGASS